MQGICWKALPGRSALWRRNAYNSHRSLHFFANVQPLLRQRSTVHSTPSTFFPVRASTPALTVTGTYRNTSGAEQRRHYKAKLVLNDKKHKKNPSKRYGRGAGSASTSQHSQVNQLRPRTREHPHKHQNQPGAYDPRKAAKVYDSLQPASDAQIGADLPPLVPASEPTLRDKQVATQLTDTLLAKMAYVDTVTLRHPSRHSLTTSEALKQGLIPGVDTRGSVPTVESIQRWSSGSSTSGDNTGDASTLIEGKLSLKLFNQVVQANAIAHRPEEAEKVVDLMRQYGLKPDARTYNFLMNAYANTTDLPGVVSTYRRAEAEGLTLDQYSYSILVKAYIRTVRLDDAFGIYDIMKQRGIRPDQSVYTQLIKACVGMKHFKRAWQVFEHMRYEVSQPDEVAFTVMIDACAKNKEVERAFNLFQEMIESGLCITEVTFNTLLNACARDPRFFTMAFQVIDQMKTQGFTPNEYTYTILIQACATANQLDKARHLFVEMVEKSNDPEFPWLAPNEVTFTNMFRAYAYAFTPLVARDVRRAQRIAETRRQQGLPVKYEVPDHIATLIDATAEQPMSPAAPSTDNETSSPWTTVDSNDAASPVPTSSLPPSPKLAAVVPSDTTEVATAGSMTATLIRQVIPVDRPVTTRLEAVQEAARLFAYMQQHCVAKADPTRPQEAYLMNPTNSDPRDIFTSHVLNAYLLVYERYGLVDQALDVFYSLFPRLQIKPVGWTFTLLLRLCAREHRIEDGLRVWQQYQQWSTDVEAYLNSPKDLPQSVRRYAYWTPQVAQQHHQMATMATAETANHDGHTGDGKDTAYQSIPTVSLEQLLNVRSDLEKYTERQSLGKGPEAEYSSYIMAVNMVARCTDQLETGIDMIKELLAKPYHEHKTYLKDFRTLYQRSVELNKPAVTSELLALCEREDKSVLYGLARKWGTKVPWDVGNTKRDVLIAKGQGDWV
ncbi:hypothetical protein H4R35_003036 [Dimargaris xerosporica]|nr:hypothetical protein H4R35_003036 [Dimargaris xerosporica]